MVNSFTTRNHYNPCFWTALWNQEYFESWLEGTNNPKEARNQIVYTLNLRGDKVHKTKVDNIHFEQNLGIAEITPESMKAFCRRWYPNEYKHISEYVSKNPETLFMDFEDTLTAIERLEIYSSIMDAARKGEVSSTIHKGFLSDSLIVHAMRSHELMNSMIEGSKTLGIEKWEYFWFLKNSWANKFLIARSIMPLAMGKWIFYKTKDYYFPLPDSPVMINRNNIMAILSPRLLLEIKLTVQRPEDVWIVRNGINSDNYREFRRRVIGNSFKDIIFHDPNTLEEWRSIPEYKNRVSRLNDIDELKFLENEAASRVLWAIFGFGRVPPDFESWIGKYLN